MNKCVLLFLVFALGITASADELDTLIYKLRGITPPPEAPAPAPAVVPAPEPQTEATAPAPEPQTEATPPAPPVAPEPTPAPAPEPPSAPTPAPPPETAPAPELAPTPETASNPSPLPEQASVPGNEFVFPAGSQPSRRADRTLEVIVPEGTTRTFSAGSRAFRLPDGTLKVIVSGATAGNTAPAAPPLARASDSTAAVATPAPPENATTRPPSGQPPIIVDVPFKSLSSDRNTLGIEDGDADDIKYYIALRGIGASMTAKVNGETVEDSSLDSFAGASLAFGHRLSDTFRMELELAGAGASDGEDTATIALGFVNFLYSAPIGEHLFFLLGGGAGLLYYKEEFEYTEQGYYSSYYYSWYYGYRSYQRRYSYTAEGSGEASLPALNAMAGLSLALSRSASLDVALRYITTLEGEYKSDEIGSADAQLDFVGGYVGLSLYF